MARLASQSKGGFYPTPPEVIERVAQLFVLGQEKIFLLDPCCGNGQALSLLKKRLEARGAVTYGYGIELSSDRAKQARELLDKVLSGSVFSTIIQPHNSFDVVFLNPPYDNGGNKERLELRFLKKARKWLADDGILILIIPLYVLANKSLASYLAMHFSCLTVLKFPKKLYSQFKQVVVLGRKRRNYDYEWTMDRLIQIGKGRQFDTPGAYGISFPFWQTLDNLEEFKIDLYYYLKIESCACGPELFISADVKPEDILNWTEEKSPLLEKFKKRIELLEDTSFTPLMTLRRGHLVQLLVSGALNGKFKGRKGEILLKGTMLKVRKEVYSDKDRIVRRDEFKICLKYFDSSGELKEVIF
jgi:tRNA1(Val) A37 N6-methylase TrmN6